MSDDKMCIRDSSKIATQGGNGELAAVVEYSQDQARFGIIRIFKSSVCRKEISKFNYYSFLCGSSGLSDLHMALYV